MYSMLRKPHIQKDFYVHSHAKQNQQRGNDPCSAGTKPPQS